MTYVFTGEAKGIKVSDAKFNRIRRIVDLYFRGVISGAEFERRMRREGFTVAQAYAIYRDILAGKYERIIKWLTILAVLTTKYEEGAKPRHLEARMVIDVPKKVYDKDFSGLIDFCSFVLEKYMEIKGYEDYVRAMKKGVVEVLNSPMITGIEVVNTFEESENFVTILLLELYDYDYRRYPFQDEIRMYPKYWEDWKRAKIYVVENLSPFELRGRAASRAFSEESILGVYQESLERWLGSDRERFKD